MLKTETTSFLSSLSYFDNDNDEPNEWEVGIESGDGVWLGVEVEDRGIKVLENDREESVKRRWFSAFEQLV